MSKSAIASSKLAPPAGPFSQAIRTEACIFFSGQVAQDPATGKIVEGGVETEAAQLFMNFASLLHAAEKSFDDVLRVGVFLTDMSDFAKVNAIYARHFSPPYPARTTVAVAALPLGACIEIDMIVAA